MKPEKRFDCVRMKNEIQAKILKRLEGMSPHEARLAKRRMVEEDPILAKFAKHTRPSSQITRNRLDHI